jgi:hypothetical protein
MSHKILSLGYDEFSRKKNETRIADFWGSPQVGAAWCWLFFSMFDILPIIFECILDDMGNAFA